MQKGYDNWASLYYGVDISPKTIDLLKEYVISKNIKVGELICCGLHDTPFNVNTFDIGACIGVLEYFDNDYVEKALIEFYRILKPNSRFVLDIPNIGGSMGKIMMSIENYIGRHMNLIWCFRILKTCSLSTFVLKRKTRLKIKQQ